MIPNKSSNKSLLSIDGNNYKMTIFMIGIYGICQLVASCFKSRYRRCLIGTALLTCLLVTTIFPAIAQHLPPLQGGQGNTASTSQIDVEKGNSLFAAGRLAEAANIWQQVAQRYEAQGNRLQQARTLNYLSLAYLNLGQWKKAESTITQSLNILKTANSSSQEVNSLLAQSLNTQGNIQLALGQTETALETWQQSAIAYQSIGDVTGQLGSQINVAKALQGLGRYQRSRTILEQMLQQLQSQSDVTIKAAGLRTLGIALQVMGDSGQSKQLLEQSLALVQQLQAQNPVFASEASATFISLGNTFVSLQETDSAIKCYQKAAAIAPNILIRTEAQLNQLSLLVKILYKGSSSSPVLTQIITSYPFRIRESVASNDPQENSHKSQEWAYRESLTLLPQIQSNLAKLSPSREAIYAEVNFAATLMQLPFTTNNQQPKTSNQQQITYISQLLATAVKQAIILQDQRAEAYALGQLGQLYERVSQWHEAKDLTEKALVIAQGINAPDIMALWQWQRGRILKQQGNAQEAIASYTNAVHTLKSLRQELVALNTDLQFSFTQSVEPVYRELVALLLQVSPDQTNLKHARELIESLQVAELDNFFREACLKIKSQQIDQVDPKAAVIYPIILPDRLAVIVSSAKQPLFYYETKLDHTEIESVIDQLRLYLNPHFFDEDRLRLSQQLYDWLIRPAEAQFKANKIETLVFVLDDSLRSLPMAALYDGKQYLIEKYSIAMTPGLQLLEPKAIAPAQLQILTAGLSESRQGFAALPAVEVEINQIASEIPSSILLNKNFTSAKLKAEISQVPFPIIHLATHGQFGVKAEDTFLVTWDGRINVKDLNELLQTRQTNLTNPIELLVLSACQTATGDKKSALGLAGFAVRSGARSTLATLWQVNDESTAHLMAKFYQQLAQKSGITKAQALRTTQLELLKQPRYQHPFYWAPFVLVGNWL